MPSSPVYPSEFEAPENWNFEPLSLNDELHGILMWEYGRQSPFLRDLDWHWEEPCIQRLSIQERQRLWPFRQFTGSLFPEKPWRKLELKAKNIFLEHTSYPHLFVHPSVETVAEEAERILQEARDLQVNWKLQETRNRQAREKLAQYCFIEITPDAWARFTNEEIRTFLHEKIISLRPKGIPNPRKNGKRFRDMKVALRRLGAMRLHALHPLSEAMKIAEKNFPEKNWQDKDTWRRIQKDCKLKLRQLFPFLPPGEEDICFPSWLDLQKLSKK
jgi:hypothetical protein